MRRLRMWVFRRQVKRARYLIQKVEDTLCAMNVPRWKRKQIWRDFIKTEDGRAAIVDILGGAEK